MSKRIILLVFILGTLSGCSLFSVQKLNSGQLILLPPSEGPRASLLKQKVTMEARGEQHQFLVVLRLEQAQLKMRALLPTGQPLLSLDYDGASLVQDNKTSIAIPGEEILAMMQFALWPKESIEKHYSSDIGWQLNIDVNQRVLSTASGVVVSVQYLNDSELLMDNHLHNYRVTIKTLESISL